MDITATIQVLKATQDKQGFELVVVLLAVFGNGISGCV